MWTCTVQTKLTDLNIFKYPLGTIFSHQHLFSVSAKLLQECISKSAIHNALDSQFDGFSGFSEKLINLSPLMVNLEPPGSRLLLNTARYWWEDIFYWYAFSHWTIRWKRTLVYLDPRLQHDLAYLEILYRSWWSYMFNVCDQAHRSPHKDRAVMIVVLILHGIKRLRETEILDLAVTDHLQLALQDRLKIFCSRIFGFDASKRIKCDEEYMLAVMVGIVLELSSCLPPHYRSHGFNKSVIEYFEPYYSPETRLDFRSCLLRRSDSSEYCYDNTKTDSCCCGWTFDSTPSGLLSIFGHSASSFARYVHFGPRETSLGEVEVHPDPCQAINTVFGGPRIDDLSLRRRMMVFRGIMSFWLRRSFRLMDLLIEILNINSTRKIPEDQLNHLANNYRQRIFAQILRSAVAMYHDFQSSEREGETGAEDWIHLSCRFSLWVAEKRNSSEIGDFDRALIKIHVERIKAEGFAPDDTDISSDQDDCSDELEEGS